MYINFQQNRAKISHNRAHKCIRQKIANCIKDGRMDGRTDRRRVRQQSVVFSKKNTKKQMHVNTIVRMYEYFFAMQECTLKIVLV